MPSVSKMVHSPLKEHVMNDQAELSNKVHASSLFVLDKVCALLYTLGIYPAVTETVSWKSLTKCDEKMRKFDYGAVLIMSQI